MEMNSIRHQGKPFCRKRKDVILRRPHEGRVEDNASKVSHGWLQKIEVDVRRRRKRRNLSHRRRKSREERVEEEGSIRGTRKTNLSEESLKYSFDDNEVTTAIKCPN